jgi:hypothetical protein
MDNNCKPDKLEGIDNSMDREMKRVTMAGSE